MDIGLVTAFIGGLLALLSPCAALLLPAFFASTVGSGPRLLLHGAIFFVGLLVVLVPLGMGAGALGSLFMEHRQAIVIVASLIMVVFGVVQILGLGFDPSRMLPDSANLHARAATATGITKTFLLGAASAIAGFCAGPILGAVLTMAATQGSPLAAGLLLAAYGAGMVAPMLLIAALWRRLGPKGRRALRGRTVTVLGREFHTTSVITGVLLIAVGIIFWMTNGLVGAPEILPLEMQTWLQGRSSVLAHPVVDLLALLVLAAIVVVLWTRRRARAQRATRETSTV